jgi:hypothetical protein
LYCGTYKKKKKSDIYQAGVGEQYSRWPFNNIKILLKNNIKFFNNILILLKDLGIVYPRRPGEYHYL